MLAPAKINLMLHITGRRDDGYHLLQSLTCFADIGDEVTLTPSPGFKLATTGYFAGAIDGENLVVKAALALASACKVKPHGTITLDKKLPVGAGLGGGSADAAATLKLLSSHWHCRIPQSLAAGLGSDIPACIESQPCWMEGAGEIITPLRMNFDLPVLLVNPGVHVSTPDVYRALKVPFNEPLTLPRSFTKAKLMDFLRSTRNMLEAPAITIAPVIDELLSVLRATKGCQLARMSGSGSTCFAIFSSQESLLAAQQALRKSHPDWWVKKTTLQGTHG